MEVEGIRLYVEALPLGTMIAGVLMGRLQANLLFSYSKNYHSDVF